MRRRGAGRQSAKSARAPQCSNLKGLPEPEIQHLARQVGVRRNSPSAALFFTDYRVHVRRSSGPRRAPSRPRFPRRPDGPRRRPPPPFRVACRQRRHRPGGEQAASIVPASIHEARRPHCHSLARPSWFLVSRAPRGQGGSGCAHHGKRAPALPPGGRRLRRVARPSRRAHPRCWGLPRAVLLAAPRPALRGQ